MELYIMGLKMKNDKNNKLKMRYIYPLITFWHNG